MTSKRTSTSPRSGDGVLDKPKPIGSSFGRKAVLVLGMHRSGTSALSGLLTKLGCVGPATPMAATAMNPKGYFESDVIYRLHEEILAAAGTAWDDYRPFPKEWLQTPMAAEYRGRMQELVASEFGRADLFVLKDPRICRMLDFWTGLLLEMGIQPLAVHIHRNPIEVAASLAERDHIEPLYGQWLWLCHALEAEHDSRPMTRAFTSYANLLGDWAYQAERLAGGLGLTWPQLMPGQDAPQLEGFIEPDLRRFSVDARVAIEDDRVPGPIREAFALFESWAAGPARHLEMSVERLRLDAIREAYRTAASMFGPLVQSRGKAILADRDNLRRQIKQAQADSEARAESEARAQAELNTTHAKLGSEIARLSAHGAELDATLARREREITTLTEELAGSREGETKAQEELDKTRVRLEGEIAALSARGIELDAALARRERETMALDEELARSQARDASLRGELIEARHALMQSHNRVKTTTNAIARLARGLPIEPYGDQTIDLATALSRLEAGLAALAEAHRAELRAAEARVADIRGSTSWRITAPLRMVARWLGKGRGAEISGSRGTSLALAGWKIPPPRRPARPRTHEKDTTK